MLNKMVARTVGSRFGHGFDKQVMGDHLKPEEHAPSRIRNHWCSFVRVSS